MTAKKPASPVGNTAGLQDNGTRKEYETGAKREERDILKGRFDLIPGYSLKQLAVHYARGSVKYGARNWEKGLPLSTFIDSMERHLNTYKEGDRSEDHIAAIAWNAFGYMWTAWRIDTGDRPIELDDAEYLCRSDNGQGWL